MPISLTSLPPIAAVSSLATMISQRNHLLMALLSLEAMTLSLVLMITKTLTKTSTVNSIFLMLILTMGACEASLGLAILVSMTRLKGSDLIKSTISMKC